LPRCIESAPNESMCVHFDDRVMDCFWEESSDGMKFRIVVPDQGGGSGIEGALRWSGEDRVAASGGACLLHFQMAVMRSVATAAGREVRICIRRERKYRRDQREAEEQQERDCQEAAHTAIVADRERRLEQSAAKSVLKFKGTYSIIEDGAPGEIRTPYPLVRSQMLYPDELRAHGEGVQHT
jgi:hypothetical protein